MCLPSVTAPEINLQAHVGRINPEGLGVVGNNRDKGFFIHPSLVINAETGFPLGLSTIQLWHREVNHQDKHQRRYPNLPIEQKESYKWLLSAAQEPIHWRLLTTDRVTSLEQALQVIEWYRWRWRIEQLFAILKQAGLDIESTHLESVGAIERLTILALSVALRILQLLEGRLDPTVAAQVAFHGQQQQCLTHLAPSLQGRTHKQQNPYPPASLPWATWLIARLGGWSGYRSQSPPGVPTLVRGLRQFESIFRGWRLAQTPLVCTP